MIEIKPDGNIEEHSLAYQLILELTKSSRRWFIAFLVTLILWFGTISVFIWYVSLPAEEVSTEYQQESDNNSRNLIIQDGDYNSSEADSEEGVSPKSN